MYDIEIAVPICTTGKYQARIQDLSKYCLVNNGNKKTSIKLLAGPEDFVAIGPGKMLYFEPGIKAEVLYFDSNCPAYKIYQYYSEIDPDSARWFAKVDDDSCTDISGLIDNLDDQFCHKKEFYVTGELVRPTEEHEIDWEVFTSLGFDRKTSLMAEREASVVSQAAMKKIFDSPGKAMIEKRAKLPGGYGDVALAMAARMAKIYAVKAEFMSSQPYLQEFSLWGGHINHVHFMYYSLRITDFWRNQFKSRPNLSLCGDYFLKTEESDPQNLNLQPNGRVGEIALWQYRNDRIYLYTGWQTPCFVFEPITDYEWYDEEAKAFLRRYKLC